MDQIEMLNQVVAGMAEARKFAALVTAQQLAAKDAEIARLTQALEIERSAKAAIEAAK